MNNNRVKDISSYQNVRVRAQAALGKDTYGYRREFINLVEKAESIDVRTVETPGIIFKGQ